MFHCLDFEGNFMRKLIISLVVVIFVFLSIFVYNSTLQEKVKIGFIGALTGKYSVLGNAMINGVLLAFEERKYKIGDKQIEIIFQDDKGDIELNKKIINQFIKDDVKIVIGNVTSSMSKVSMSIINEHKDMFMISAASASNEFTGKDDQFFRVHVANNAQRFDNFTDFVIDKGYKKIYGIYDPGNPTYTKDYLENFEKSFMSKNQDAFLAFGKTNENLGDLVADIKEKNPDMILICANSVDAAKVVQYIRLKGLPTVIASSEWAQTKQFIENGGKSVEGVIFNIDLDENAQNPRYQKFLKRYQAKYKDNPSIFASKAYELSQIIIQMLEKGEQTDVKKHLLEQKVFNGLQDEIVFDEYGDVIRNFYTFVIKDGKYVRVK
mgnify:CR=1 FL=1